MNKKILLALLIAAVLVAPALAILGLGDIVFDPTNYEEAIQEFVQLSQQYVQLVQTYQMVENQYNQMLRMAQQVPVNMIQRYQALATPWTPSTATNAYGTTSGWIAGINGGSDVMAGYTVATSPLGTYGNAFGSIPADQQDRVKKSYANVELTDGANLSGIQTVGQIRGNATGVEAAISNLENDTLSSDPSMNTEIAVLNKINAANLIDVRNTQDANKLLVAMTEQQILQAKRQRDAEAQAFNEHIQFVTNGQAVMAAQAANASSAMLAWQMP
jgi:isoleucyl-tRNA synthetase